MCFSDELRGFMAEALKEAAAAAEAGEVPVGAVVVRDGKILARGRNRRLEGDPLAHAEIEALRNAAAALGGWHLDDCDLVVTLEPCPMCTGALMQAHIRRVYFGAFDPKAGCCGSLVNLPEDPRFASGTRVYGGFMREECARLLTDFFESLRQRRG